VTARAAVRFDLGVLPSKAKIVSAKLQLHVIDASSAKFMQDIHLHPLTARWEGPFATWERRTATEAWTLKDRDDIADIGPSVATISFKALKRGAWATFELPPALVEGWVRDPAGNHGLMVKPFHGTDPDKQNPIAKHTTACFASSEHGDPALRPKLVLTCDPGGNVKPSAALVLDGMGEPFLPAGEKVTLKATAGDPDGTVKGVTFFVDGKKAGEATASPWTVTTAMKPGVHAVHLSVRDDGGETMTTEPVEVRCGALLYEADMEKDPGWTLAGEWAHGKTQGKGGKSGFRDPARAVTGVNVIGVNLEGDRVSRGGGGSATTPAIDCSRAGGVRLSFWAWCGINWTEQVSVEVSGDGKQWKTLWDSRDARKGKKDMREMKAVIPCGGAWDLHVYDISSVADGKAAVQVRWTVGRVDGPKGKCGWSLDDVRVTGVIR
jgi:hypothetical protein